MLTIVLPDLNSMERYDVETLNTISSLDESDNHGVEWHFLLWR